MSVTEEVSHEEISRLNALAEKNIPPMLVTEEVSHEDISLLNADAPQSSPDMSVTPDTSQFEISSLKVLRFKKRSFILVTPELKHQSPIGPYWVSTDALSASNQLPIAVESSSSDWKHGFLGAAVGS